MNLISFLTAVSILSPVNIHLKNIINFNNTKNNIFIPADYNLQIVSANIKIKTK